MDRPMGRTGKTIFTASLVVSVAAITYLHHITGMDKQPLHSIYNELHYIPVLAAALLFGVRGALFSFLLISLFYLTYLLFDWSGTLIFLMDNFVHLVFPGLIGLVLGAFVDEKDNTDGNWKKKGTCRDSARPRLLSFTT